MTVKIELRDKKSTLRSGVFGPLVLLAVRQKKDATVTEIRDAMIAVLREPVDSAPVYLTVNRFIKREEPLLKATPVKKGQVRRFALTQVGAETAKEVLATYTHILKAFS